jgi:hypothetical protein
MAAMMETHHLGANAPSVNSPPLCFLPLPFLLLWLEQDQVHWQLLNRSLKENMEPLVGKLSRKRFLAELPAMSLDFCASL